MLRILPRILVLAMAGLPAVQAQSRLEPAAFASPANEYRPVNCWWWDGAPLSKDKLKLQIQDLHAKGIGGTWLYPRYGAGQFMSCEPGYWSDGWWEHVKFSLAEHERLGMTQWSNDWLGRLDKSYFQSILRSERDAKPELTGRRLVAYQADSSRSPQLQLTALAGETILAAAAYQQKAESATKIDLLDQVKDQSLAWTAPGNDWVMILVTHQPHDLDYLGSAVVKRWTEIYFEEYQRRLGPHLGKGLAAYGPDERHVLNGSILYSEALRERIQKQKGYDPRPDLPALFLNIGSRTAKIRCDYYGAMAAMLDEHLYEPIHRWLRERGMKQATVATWGRQDLLGQTSNYGDFFSMMGRFDITGNEDSAESNPTAFLDTKFSSSIAHMQGRPRVAVCAYWGLGWGYTPQQSLARTNGNYALGVTLYNSHGGMYSLMGGRNEFVPPSIEFYQPYWKTWRTHSDYVSRLSYALSQGVHRADVALVYPLSTLHASWHDGAKFDPAAKEAQRSLFALAHSIHGAGLDFDFVDEASLAAAVTSDGQIKPGQLEFPVVVLPAISTLRLDVLKKLEAFVSVGGKLVVIGEPPTTSAERGGNDPAMISVWKRLEGQFLRVTEVDAAKAILAAITPDVTTDTTDLTHTHQQVGRQHVYYFVNRLPTARSVEVTVRGPGMPEIWDAFTGRIAPHHRFESLEGRTRLRLDMAPHAGVLVVMQPGDTRPRVVSDTFTTIDDVRRRDDGYEIVGTASGDVRAKIVAGGKSFTVQATIPPAMVPIPIEGNWEIEYRPTLQNKWGDFRYPARDEWIGPETPVMKYRDEPATRPDWQLANLNDRDWKNVKCTFGPYWRVLGPIASAKETPVFRAAALQGKGEGWSEYCYSRSLGADHREIHQQSYEGIGVVPAEFLVFDRPGGKAAVWWLATRIYSPKAQKRNLLFGRAEDPLPRQAWVNGKPVIDGPKQAVTEVELCEGWNDVVLRIADPDALRKGKSAKAYVDTFAMFQESAQMPSRPRFMPLSPWKDVSPELIHDVRAADEKRVGWYRFRAPPGARTAVLPLEAVSVEAWIDGRPVTVTDGLLKFPESNTSSTIVALRVDQKPGRYEGAAFTAPIRFECGRGSLPLGDWSRHGLAHYSGGLRYSKTVTLTKEQLDRRITLDLGDVRVSAEVSVNGKPQGVRLAAPFSYDITAALQPGENKIEVEVLNTLANFMSAAPTRYVFEGQTVSGLLGPASLKFAAPVTLTCR